MSLTSDLVRGHTESIILARLMGKDSYGYEINKAVAAKTRNQYELKEATLYSAFRRLEAGGYIASYWGDAEQGARRRYYAITPLGRQCFAESLADWAQAKALIDSLLAQEDPQDPHLQ
ncbi:MAG: PadR family transcriptional regulator [Oscillospiraceae bacterium]|nr:PadR family transcriptional regulator [Oscillospiraceae bacterium]